MYDYERAYTYLLSETKFDPVYAAMDAVKRLIPMTVIDNKEGINCPKCEQLLEDKLINLHNIKHCPFCGQALKLTRG